jgi:hypothetical protein
MRIIGSYPPKKAIQIQQTGINPLEREQVAFAFGLWAATTSPWPPLFRLPG